MEELPERKAGYFTRMDGRRGFALVARDPDLPQELIAVVLYVCESSAPEGSGSAEYAALVEDRWQGKGLGLGLTQVLVEIARRRGIRRFWSLVLPENERALNLLRDLDLPENERFEDGLRRVELDLSAASQKS